MKTPEEESDQFFSSEKRGRQSVEIVAPHPNGMSERGNAYWSETTQ